MVSEDNARVTPSRIVENMTSWRLTPHNVNSSPHPHCASSIVILHYGFDYNSMEMPVVGWLAMTMAVQILRIYYQFR